MAPSESGDAQSGPSADEAAAMPRIQLGPHSVSRLICGANPFGAGSHLSVFVNHEMRRYYTQEQILKTLGRCREVGINCWQSGGDSYKLYQRLLDNDGNDDNDGKIGDGKADKMHYISLGSGDGSGIDALAGAGCIGVAHHGEVTDTMFKEGRIDEMREYLARVRDSGLLVGVSTHMPAVVDAVESKGWDVDFYMTCVYERHRTAAELKELLGQAPIPVSEVYLPDDPPRMFKAMRETARPCLAFKILAAGRLSERPEWVERAYRETFESIKPTDAVIVGIYDRYSDQAAEGAAFVRRFGSGGSGGGAR